ARLDVVEDDLFRPALEGREVIGGVAGRAVVVGDHTLLGREGPVPGVGALERPGAAGPACQEGTAGAVRGAPVSVVGGDRVRVGGPVRRLLDVDPRRGGVAVVAEVAVGQAGVTGDGYYRLVLVAARGGRVHDQVLDLEHVLRRRIGRVGRDDQDVARQ